MELTFGQYFAADVWLGTKLNLGQDYEARFGQDLKLKFSRDADVCKMNSTLGSFVPLAMFLIVSRTCTDRASI